MQSLIIKKLEWLYQYEKKQALRQDRLGEIKRNILSSQLIKYEDLTILNVYLPKENYKSQRTTLYNDKRVNPLGRHSHLKCVHTKQEHFKINDAKPDTT